MGELIIDFAPKSEAGRAQSQTQRGNKTHDCRLIIGSTFLSRIALLRIVLLWQEQCEES